MEEIILPAAEPTSSNEIIQHNPENLSSHNDEFLQHDPENLPHNEIIMFTNSQQRPAIALEQDILQHDPESVSDILQQDILHDNESEIIAEEVEILQHDPENVSDILQHDPENVSNNLQHDPESVSNNELLHEHDDTTIATNSSQVNEDTKGFLDIQCSNCLKMDEISYDIFSGAGRSPRQL